MHSFNDAGSGTLTHDRRYHLLQGCVRQYDNVAIAAKTPVCPQVYRSGRVPTRVSGGSGRVIDVLLKN